MMLRQAGQQTTPQARIEQTWKAGISTPRPCPAAQRPRCNRWPEAAPSTYCLRRVQPGLEPAERFVTPSRTHGSRMPPGPVRSTRNVRRLQRNAFGCRTSKLRTPGQSAQRKLWQLAGMPCLHRLEMLLGIQTASQKPLCCRGAHHENPLLCNTCFGSGLQLVKLGRRP